MTPIQYRLHGRFWSSLLLAASLGGCGGFGGDLLDDRQQITIDSDPQNASVFAEGVEIGTTPLEIRPNEVFHARFTSGSRAEDGIITFRYVGTLSIKKPGCEPYTTQVNDNILSKDIQVTLVCDPNYRPVEAQPAIPTPAAGPPAAPAPAPAPQETRQVQPAGSAEERLLRIESLHRKGLLSDEEYQSLRQRILDTL